MMILFIGITSSIKITRWQGNGLQCMVQSLGQKKKGTVYNMRST
jgi:hypothetical protein